jgi:hypothetical protein
VSAPSPLDARRFFVGRWRGEGTLWTRGPARLLIGYQGVTLEGTGEWLSERAWRVHERFTLASGLAFERHMQMEEVAAGRVHASGDDLPLGAEIELAEDGFRFRRFPWLGGYRRLRLRFGCASDARLDADGVLHAVIQLDLFRLPVATLRLAIRIERHASEGAGGPFGPRPSPAPRGSGADCGGP